MLSSPLIVLNSIDCAEQCSLVAMVLADVVIMGTLPRSYLPATVPGEERVSSKKTSSAGLRGVLFVNACLASCC